MLVVCGDRIYRWSPAKSPATPSDASEQPTAPTEFHFTPIQSSFAINGNNETLQHHLSGGAVPYNYFLMTRIEGVSIDDQSGDLRIDRDALLAAARASVRSIAGRSTTAADVMHQLQANSIGMIADFKRLTNRTPKGFPIAVPIHVKASDNDGKVAEIQYFVLIDFPLAELAEQVIRTE